MTTPPSPPISPQHGPAKAGDPVADRGRVVGLLFGFFPAQVSHAIAQLDVAERLPPTGYSVLRAVPA
ncbi:hypothetical protein [Pseudonocardia asaccharolytica]|uniref:hypothetical protein n=1 Tax=Pseudonocardia asaccharolytica TaxID=54010 RepID=UPI0011BD895D|nr:hypothetical protein [Pseudonocardia asaccharolytica]